MCQSATHWLILSGSGGGSGKIEVRSAPQEDAPVVGELPDGLLRVEVPDPATGSWCRILPEELQRLREIGAGKEAWVLVDGKMVRRVGSLSLKDPSGDEDDPEVELDSSILPSWAEAEANCQLLPSEEGEPAEEQLKSLDATVSDEALMHLLRHGYAIVDNALPGELCATLRGELDTLLERGQMWDSQSYSEEEGAVHHDICETTLDFRDARAHAPTFAQIENDQGLLRILRRLPALKGLSMQHLRLQINKGHGGCYTMHTDSGISEPEGAGGAVQVLRATALFYLNEGWEKEHGGELRLYPYPLPPVRIPPVSGRLVLFEPRMVHEVLPNFRKRYCFTLWCANSLTSSAARSTFLDVESMTDFEAASRACMAFRRSSGTLSPQLESVPSPLRSLFLPEVRPLLVRYVFRDCELQSASRSHNEGPQKDFMLQGISRYHQQMKDLNPAWFRLLLELLPSAASKPMRSSDPGRLLSADLVQLVVQHCLWWEPSPDAQAC
ncbi:egl-9 [Symbiodinium natans]|uniref:Egl-9 protein n=1 Tax=Symbiodinium natans TaxID=878477 RepID=A0A812SNE3_9DINO|nr:egl-9 [Symbiodinium natans]